MVQYNKKYIKMKFYLIVSLLISLAIVANSIEYCQGCVDSNLKFICNGKMCEGFQFQSNTTHPVILGVDCKQKKDPCYVQDKFENATNTYYYIACNASMSNCGACYEKADCATCYSGFHSYNYEVESDFHHCKACSDSVPGCIKCANGQVCQVCDEPYRLMSDGLCHNRDGTLVDGINNSTTGIFILLIIITVFLGIGLIMLGFAVKRKYIDHHRHEPLLHS